MSAYQNTSFIKLAVRFFIVFFILIGVFRILMGIFRFDGIEGMLNHYFYDGNWKSFVTFQLGASLFYGLFMAGYYKFIKKK